MKFRLGCQLDYRVLKDSTSIFNIGVVRNQYQKILEESYYITPDLNIEEYTTPSGESRYWRVNFTPGLYRVIYGATVQVKPLHTQPTQIIETSPATLPPATWIYLYPSRYCPSDKLMSFAQEQFSHLQLGYSRVEAVCQWIHNHVAYQPGKSDSHTDALETMEQRAGVCRDFAHLGITLCRSLEIPARYVSAYAYGLEPADFHACFEAYLGDRWYLFDPTQKVSRDSIVRIGTGRDAADVSFATIFGQTELQQMKIEMQPVSEQDQSQLKPSKDAIAIAAPVKPI